MLYLQPDRQIYDLLLESAQTGSYLPFTGELAMRSGGPTNAHTTRVPCQPVCPVASQGDLAI